MTRTITVYNSSTQQKTVLENVEVSTLGELKTLFRENNIDYDGMDFMEGVSQTKLINDSSVLPHDIPYKGNTTNDLLIYMSLKDKKVRSGLCTCGVELNSLDRKALLNFIKDKGWVKEINEHFGQNYTRISSEELRNWVSFYKVNQPEPENEADLCATIKDSISRLVEALVNNGMIDDAEAAYIMRPLNAPKKESGFSMEEIEEMTSAID